MDVTPVSAIGSGRSSHRAEIAGDNEYDRQVRIARRFRDAEERRRRQQPPPPRKPAADEVDASDGDEPRAGVELDTYL